MLTNDRREIVDYLRKTICTQSPNRPVRKELLRDDFE
jgi:hypothetical protein